jgi:thioredoxin-related protein
MKKIYLFSLLFLFAGLSNSLFAQFQFQNLTLQEAVNKSAAENKPVFLMMYQSTCGHCEKMLNEVMPDSSIVNFYTAHFICIKAEMLTDPDAQKLAKHFYVQSFPTYAIIDKNAETIFQFVGEFKAADFVKMGELALQPDQQLPNLKSNFLLHTSDSVACYNYLTGLSRGRLATQPVVNIYFTAIKDHFEYSLYNWKIFSMAVSDMESEVFQFMRLHRKEFAEIVTQKKVDRKLYLTAAYNLQTTSGANDTTAFNKIKKLSLELGLTQVDSMVFITSLNLAEKNKQWPQYISNAISGGEKYGWGDATLLRRMSETIYQNTTDKSQLQKAANFAVRSAELKPDYFSNLSAAKIYLKMGYKDFAKKYADAAIDLGSKNNINVSEANLVLSQCGE